MRTRKNLKRGGQTIAGVVDNYVNVCKQVRQNGSTIKVQNCPGTENPEVTPAPEKPGVIKNFFSAATGRVASAAKSLGTGAAKFFGKLTGKSNSSDITSLLEWYDGMYKGDDGNYKDNMMTRDEVQKKLKDPNLVKDLQEGVKEIEVEFSKSQKDKGKSKSEENPEMLNGQSNSSNSTSNNTKLSETLKGLVDTMTREENKNMTAENKQKIQKLFGEFKDSPLGKLLGDINIQKISYTPKPKPIPPQNPISYFDDDAKGRMYRKGGKIKTKFMKTSEKALISNNRMRLVYLGPKGGKYVKVNGSFVTLKSVKAPKIKLSHHII